MSRLWVLLDVLDDRFVHGVAGHPHRPAVDDARERDDRHVGGSAADVHHHVARGLGDRHPRTNRSGHGLFDEVHLARLGSVGAVLHGAPLHLRDLGRHPDDDARADEPPPRLRLADEIRQHPLGRFEVGDHAVAHRSNRGDVAGRPSQHLLGLVAHGFDFRRHLVDRDDGGLARDDALAPCEHAGVRGPEIDGEVVGEEREGAQEHVGSLREVG